MAFSGGGRFGGMGMGGGAATLWNQQRSLRYLRDMDISLSKEHTKSCYDNRGSTNVSISLNLLLKNEMSALIDRQIATRHN